MDDLLDKIIRLQAMISGDRGSDDEHRQNKNGTMYTFKDLVGINEDFLATVRYAMKAASSDSTVLIWGETGTGKELFAQAIHNANPNSKEPFIAINCAAIPETLLEGLLFGTVKGVYTGSVDKPGFFEQAQQGTLFLDEINSMGINIQAKLLRVLQEKSVRRLGGLNSIPVHCRVISSTNIDPLLAMKQGLIRSLTSTSGLR